MWGTGSPRKYCSGEQYSLGNTVRGNRIYYDTGEAKKNSRKKNPVFLNSFNNSTGNKGKKVLLGSTFVFCRFFSFA